MRISDWSSDVCSSDLDDQVEVVRATGDHAALAHALECGDLVADTRCQFKVEPVGRRLHRYAEFVSQLIGLAFQQARGVAQFLRVIVFADQIHARRRTALDMMLQTGRSEEHTSELQS